MTIIDASAPPISPGRLFIGGEWRDARDGRTAPSVNPADGSDNAPIAQAATADLADAVEAARKAFDEGPWPGLSGHERGYVLSKVADLIERDGDELAYLETVDMGKPITFSKQENGAFVAMIYRYYAGLAAQSAGATRSTYTPTFTYTLQEPIGVVAAIPPFNLPLVLSSAKIAPALAAGNTVVHKPAETTPLSALKMAALFAEAGLPEGVLNVVTGPGRELGAALVSHPGVDGVAFTGSTDVGRSIVRSSAQTLKRLQLELGGKSANIVFADAYLDEAVQHAFYGIFYNQGEVCTAGSRLLVQREVHDEVVARLVAQAGEVVPGDPRSAQTTFGPLAYQAHYERVLDYIRIGQQEGAELATGGLPFQPDGLAGGCYLTPAIFTGVRNDMRIAQEEIFGPVLSVIPFDTEQEAVALANDSDFGLASGVHTSDIRRGHRVARRLRAGTCWINTYNQFDPGVPFGGVKASGYGRDFGPEALEAFQQTKSVWVDQSA